MKARRKICIAILKTKTGIITDEELENAFFNNNDGAGIAYTVDNKIIVKKGLFNVVDFINAVRDAESVCTGNMLIHCRIGTSGLRDEENTHPFYIDDNTVLIHNGILDVDVPENSTKNDTQIYIEQYLRGFNSKDLMVHKGLQKLISHSIGSGNKFVILNNEDKYVIINESAGHWKNGVWFSNRSYKTIKTLKLSHNTHSYNNWFYDEPEDKFFISSNESESSIFCEYINELTLEDFDSLGYNPLIDYDTLELVPNDIAHYKEDIYDELADYDDLYDIYLDRYSELAEEAAWAE